MKYKVKVVFTISEDVNFDKVYAYVHKSLLPLSSNQAIYDEFKKNCEEILKESCGILTDKWLDKDNMIKKIIKDFQNYINAGK